MTSRDVPIKTIHLFPVLDQLLIELLKSLSPEDWDKPTLAKLWTVKDIAAHLLDGNMRTISSKQQFTGETPSSISNYQDLVNYLNELNATWVKAMKRVSPALLVQLLEITGKQYAEHMASLDPFARAIFSVAWAGEEQSVNWFHIAREYTERWHHQQQIREAVNKPGIMHQELFYPCIATFMYALPHTYRNVNADVGTLIEIIVLGETTGNWYLQKSMENWVLTTNNDKPADCVVSISTDTAWKLFTKGITPNLALQNSTLKGNIKLGEKIFEAVAVMA
ncbi:maleylpyruvate isomerase N-terminal domain-containing protein [Mucilaginibacter lappiensis]|uniref:maleylpyruvate isomerase N-terminal domain-containing protein n=1 Tax=Mucilaginibacter lappiensis TaxID=354630 RepID=UPI003D23085B